MAEQRIIVLIPSATDLLPDQRQYFDNFVWYVKTLVDHNHLNAQIVIGQPEAPKEHP